MGIETFDKVPEEPMILLLFRNGRLLVGFRRFQSFELLIGFVCLDQGREPLKNV
jgi:hypothetical protein